MVVVLRHWANEFEDVPNPQKFEALADKECPVDLDTICRRMFAPAHAYPKLKELLDFLQHGDKSEYLELVEKSICTEDLDIPFAKDVPSLSCQAYVICSLL